MTAPVTARQAANPAAASADRADKPKNAADKFLEAALAFKGIPYLWGGGHVGSTFSKPGRVDCSGLVMQAARMAGIGLNLDGTAAIQQDKGKSVSLQDLKPGDLLFKNDPASHVGIYLGNGQFLHAPRTGDVVKIQSMSSYQWSGARRVFDEGGEPIDPSTVPDAAAASGGDSAALSSGGAPSRMSLPGSSGGGPGGGSPGGGSPGGSAGGSRSGGAPSRSAGAPAPSRGGGSTYVPTFDWAKMLSDMIEGGMSAEEAQAIVKDIKAGDRKAAMGKLQAKGLPAPALDKLTQAIDKAPAMGAAHERRDSWFISQYGSNSNTNEDTPGSNNGNCGPTSLTMIAKAFGKVAPDAGQADAAIEDSRKRMGDSQSETAGTSVAGIERGAKSYGLDARTRFDANLATIQEELSQGRLVVAHVGTFHLSGRRGGGHYTVVTAIQDGKVYLNDPAHKAGPMVVDAATFMESLNDRGTHAMVSIGQ